MILHAQLHLYQGYHHNRIYHGAHGHYHEIYRFPVNGYYGVEYRPYSYCEGNYFETGYFGPAGPVFGGGY